MGRKKHQHKEWISTDTLQKIEVRKRRKAVLNMARTRATKAKAQEDYTAAEKEVTRSVNKDRRDHIESAGKASRGCCRTGQLGRSVHGC